MKNTFFTRMKQRWVAYKTELKSMPEEQRKKKYLELLLIALVALGVCAIISGMLVEGFANLFTGGKAQYGILYYAFANPIGLFFTIVLFAACVVGYFAIEFKRNLNNGELFTDKRGVTFMLNSTQGSSRMMNEEEAKDVFYVGDICDTKNTVYGQFTDKGKEVVAFKEATNGSSGNRNLLLLGSPGTGKSYCFVRTEIIQSALRGDSIIVTDPSGELYNTANSFLTELGYDVRILNLVDPRYSDFWNCMDEVIDPETNRLDSTRLNDFTDIYMNNIGEIGAKKDQFWSDGATNLLRAVIGHASWTRESYILVQYKNLFKEVALPSEKNDTIFNNVITDMTSFRLIEKLILDAAKESECDLKKVEDSIKQINESAPNFTIKEVFTDMMRFNDIVGDFEPMPMSHPARQAYKIFSNGSDTVKASTLLGTQLKFQIFADEKLSGMLSNSGINIPEVNMRKSAYFVVMNEKSGATRPIASLFFSFFLKDAMDNWDKNDRIAEEKGEKNPCRDTTVILDEFFSIGVIGGSASQFAQTMSVNRKRHLNINIIVQSIGQIKERYGENNAETIQTCCDYIMFLGCNDPGTAKFISEFISGQATVLNESHSESTNPLGTIGDGANVRFGQSKRAVLTVDEARRWKNKVLLTKRGELPLELKMFPWTQHPCALAGELKPKSVYSNIKPIEERVGAVYAVAKEHSYEETVMAIKNIKAGMSPEKLKKFEKAEAKKKLEDIKKENEAAKNKIEFPNKQKSGSLY